MPTCCVDVRNTLKPALGVKIVKVRAVFTFKDGTSVTETSTDTAASGESVRVCTGGAQSGLCVKSVRTAVTFQSEDGDQKQVSIVNHADEGLCLTNIPLQPKVG